MNPLYGEQFFQAIAPFLSQTNSKRLRARAASYLEI
jgi:hypothetical protein